MVDVLDVISAVHDASAVMAAELVKPFFSVPDMRRWNATFWICPKFSAQVTAGIDVNDVAAGHEQVNAIVI